METIGTIDSKIGFYIGDPCYILPDSIYRQFWGNSTSSLLAFSRTSQDTQSEDSLWREQTAETVVSRTIWDTITPSTAERCRSFPLNSQMRKS